MGIARQVVSLCPLVAGAAAARGSHPEGSQPEAPRRSPPGRFGEGAKRLNGARPLAPAVSAAVAVAAVIAIIPVMIGPAVA